MICQQSVQVEEITAYKSVSGIVLMKIDGMDWYVWQLPRGVQESYCPTDHSRLVAPMDKAVFLRSYDKAFFALMQKTERLLPAALIDSLDYG